MTIPFSSELIPTHPYRTFFVGTETEVPLLDGSRRRYTNLDNAASTLDFVMISAHKMYAPFGTGVLAGRRDVFERGDPDMTGGGTVEIVTMDDVVWAGPPERDEAGSPNTVGAVALAAAIRQLEAIGMQAVAAHEAGLTEYALEK